MTTLEFSVVKATLGLTHGEYHEDPPRIQLKLKYAGSETLVNSDGELLEFENWLLLISPKLQQSDTEDQESVVGSVKKISFKLISATVQLPASVFQIVLQALLGSKVITAIELEIDDLNEIDSKLMWSSPENESLVINAIDFTFHLQ